MIDQRAVEVVCQTIAETSWLPTPCPVEYLPALARDILYDLERADLVTE